MTKWLLVVGPARGTEGIPTTVPGMLSFVYDRLQGRVLGSLIRPGMTWAETVPLLANLVRSGRGVMNQPEQGHLWVYSSRCGLFVRFRETAEGSLRVDWVKLYPFFARRPGP